MSEVLFEYDKDVKVFGWGWNGRCGHDRWFVYVDHKFNYIERVSRGIYSTRLAVPEDWMNIGDDDGGGFVECDFRGCDFTKYDISGTRFVRCLFDYDSFDYSYVDYSGMVDCKFGSEIEISKSFTP